MQPQQTAKDTIYSLLLRDVEKVVVDARHSTSGFVEDDRDWDVLISLFMIWSRYYPKEYQDFIESVETIRSNTLMNKGILKGKGGGLVQHQLELPYRWWKLVQVLYPKQHIDDSFVKKASKKLRVLNVSNSVL